MSDNKFHSARRWLFVVFVVVILFAVLANMSGVSAASAGEDPYPAYGTKVWEVRLNQYTDVVAPTYSLRCGDIPVFTYQGIVYFGYRQCFLFHQRLFGQWWLEEWRGQIGVPLVGLEAVFGK